MASLKEVKNRINSVKSTRKITSAMKMVASAKLHRAQGAIENMLPYQQKMNRILLDFLGSTEVSLDNPFTVEREVKRVAVVVFSSNSSLCGAFNANVIKRVVEVTGKYQNLGKENILIFPVGKKIEEAVKKLGYTVQGSYQDMANKPNYADASALATHLIELFNTEQVDRVELIYHHFKSAGSQALLTENYLPIQLADLQKDMQAEEAEEADARKRVPDYIVEPSTEEFIGKLLPTVFRLKIFTALLDNAASEHAARVMAMQTATENADGLIDDLTLQYNKTRQQTITSELLDIIGGSMK